MICASRRAFGSLCGFYSSFESSLPFAFTHLLGQLNGAFIRLLRPFACQHMIGGAIVFARVYRRQRLLEAA
jgi:hypothetical protein